MKHGTNSKMEKKNIKDIRQDSFSLEADVNLVLPTKDLQNLSNEITLLFLVLSPS